MLHSLISKTSFCRKQLVLKSFKSSQTTILETNKFVENVTRQWVKGFVVKNHLCPWANQVMDANHGKNMNVTVYPDCDLSEFANQQELTLKVCEVVYGEAVRLIANSYPDVEVMKKVKPMSDLHIPVSGDVDLERQSGEGHQTSLNCPAGNEANGCETDIPITPLVASAGDDVSDSPSSSTSTAEHPPSFRTPQLRTSVEIEKLSMFRTSKAKENADMMTSLVVLPVYASSFEEYLILHQILTDVFDDTGVSDYIQLATFHPGYVFEGSKRQQVENWTNRSPYPMFHLLRVNDVTRAIDQYDNKTSKIWKENVRKMKDLGEDQIKVQMKDIIERVVADMKLDPQCLVSGDRVQ